jgi:hypothetical protein
LDEFGMGSTTEASSFQVFFFLLDFWLMGTINQTNKHLTGIGSFCCSFSNRWLLIHGTCLGCLVDRQADRLQLFLLGNVWCHLVVILVEV